MNSNLTQVYFEDHSWLHALTLKERSALRGSWSGGSVRNGFDRKLAEKRLQRWEAQPPFTDDGHLSKRLEIAQLTRGDFLRILGEPVTAFAQRVTATPKWLAELAAAFAHRRVIPEAALNQAAVSATQPTGLGVLALPLIERGRERLRQGIKALQDRYLDLPFDPDTIEDLLLLNLPAQLLGIYGRTMVLELNVARLQGILEGNTPEDRFKDFVRRLDQPEFTIPILQEYTVLARLLTTTIDHWVRFSIEFLSHLCADWQSIRASLSKDADPGALVGISAGAGDTHREGRSVVIASFASGFKVVYKPHSLSVDVHFNELLEWINEHGNHPSFRTIKVIQCGDHGWVEFVPATGCSSEDEVRRFYQRQGGYLALLYALEATDFHYENLIASGEYPVLIDLEALFHPRNEPEATPHEFFLPAYRLMTHSVLRVGLLPQRIWAKDEDASDGIDMSGLGGEAGQLSPYRAVTWDKIATDEMHAVRKRIEMLGSLNRPSLDGAEIKAVHYVDEIVAGFNSIYELLIRCRDELLADDDFLSRFADDEVRAVLRPTRVYGMLLGESYHPDVLRDALDRDRLLDRLWVGIEQMPYMANVILAEQEDLRRGDIPVFASRPGSRSVWTSANEEVRDFFDERSLDAVRRRLQSMDEKDLERQSWFIRASMTTLTMGLTFERPEQRSVANVPEVVANREHLIAEARAIADRLEMLALRDEENISWIGVTLVNERTWTLAPAGGELYSGTNGLALFFAYAGAITGEQRYRSLAEFVVANSKRLVKLLREQKEANSGANQSNGNRAIGSYSGWGGLIYTLAHLAVLWDDASLLAEAESLVEILPDLIERDESFDVLSGSAGCVAGLLTLYRCKNSERTLKVAIQAGDHLLAHAQQAGPGIAWTSKVASTQPLTGFSHGASGIGWSLLELFAVTGEQRFKKAALDAFTYERSVFLPETGNWPDYRILDVKSESQKEDPSRPEEMVTWCHGAPGIGLARLRALETLKDSGEDVEGIRADLNVALQTTLKRGFGVGHSLCHGDLGNLELLLQASLKLNDAPWHVERERLTGRVFNSMKKFGWICGVPGSVETPGLLTGLAGIGYGLLRLAEPRRVPSVLLLEPPVMNSK